MSEINHDELINLSRMTKIHNLIINYIQATDLRDENGTDPVLKQNENMPSMPKKAGLTL